MLTLLMIMFWIFMYAFCARLTYNFGEFLFGINYKEYTLNPWYTVNDKESGMYMAIFFPFTVSWYFTKWLCKFMIQFPIKLADYISDPSKYNFKIEIRRK